MPLTSLFPFLLFLLIPFLFFYFINKWVTQYFAYKQEQNELLKDLVNKVDKALEKRNTIL